ncbi:MAG: hypothetical protein ABL897_03295 [Hyphomicrobium sp.]
MRKRTGLAIAFNRPAASSAAAIILSLSAGRIFDFDVCFFMHLNMQTFANAQLNLNAER